MKRIICLMAAVIFMLSGCGDNGEERGIRVFVDSSLNAAMNEAVKEYTAENPVNIEIVSGSTSALFNRIEKGADCDIFIPSSKEQINSLIKDEYLKEENVTPILKNNVVLIKGYGSSIPVKSFDTVTEARNIALAKENEPIGVFAREIFINLNVFKEVLNMTASSYDDSPSVAAAVAEGKNQIGVCFETDALANADKVQIITASPKDSLNSEAIYSVAVMNTDDGLEPNETVKDFGEYLDTPEAAEIFAEFDFDIYIN
ncbi:MAG: molybdate ABC transporter substrate-binding protein [Clostridia bacterium]|nr:molybdate ABC transporter substrate-binding protein [Clostridia bacterium]